MRGSLSAVVFAFAIAASGCQHSRAAAPAWPAASTTADDGGESIEPRPTAVASAVESSDDDDEAVTPDAEPAAKPAAAPEADKPATVTAPTQPPDGEVIMSEEIIIEIDD